MRKQEEPEVSFYRDIQLTGICPCPQEIYVAREVKGPDGRMVTREQRVLAWGLAAGSGYQMVFPLVAPIEDGFTALRLPEEDTKEHGNEVALVGPDGSRLDRARIGSVPRGIVVIPASEEGGLAPARAALDARKEPARPADVADVGQAQP